MIPSCWIPPKKVCATFIREHFPENLRCHHTQRQILHPQLFFQLGNDQVEERRTELIELFHKFVRFSDIVKLIVWCVLNNYFREVLANMSLQPIRRGLTDLNGQAKGRIIQSLNKVVSIRQPYIVHPNRRAAWYHRLRTRESVHNEDGRGGSYALRSCQGTVPLLCPSTRMEER
jgi:hypothetical protein